MVLKIDKIPLVEIVISAATQLFQAKTGIKILITYLRRCGPISIFLCVYQRECVRVCVCAWGRWGENGDRNLKKNKKLWTHSVVVCAVNVSWHAKVSYLDQQVFSYQAVPGCQVSVDEVLGGQVDHASGNLLGNVQHLGLGELHQDTVLTVCHQHCIRAVGPAPRNTSSGLQSLEKTWRFVMTPFSRNGRFQYDYLYAAIFSQTSTGSNFMES